MTFLKTRFSGEEFIKILKILQPYKKFTYGSEQYWFRNGVPIYGIIAKLFGGAIHNKKRRRIISDMLGIELKIKTISDGELFDIMVSALYSKFSQHKYKKILIDTNNEILGELAMRGNSKWTYGGKNILGKILMVIRSDKTI